MVLFIGGLQEHVKRLVYPRLTTLGVEVAPILERCLLIWFLVSLHYRYFVQWVPRQIVSCGQPYNASAYHNNLSLFFVVFC